ncbi:MAG: SpvB/TcaC N-terminal domain-containing protein [Planctomycetota bacterium]
MDYQSVGLWNTKCWSSIREIGLRFAANSVTGNGSVSIPVATSTGRSGFGPQLSLSCDSGSGHGPFGFGWHLSLMIHLLFFDGQFQNSNR